MSSLRVFRGQIYAVGFKPDGDTLAFKPNDPDALRALPDTNGKTNVVVFDPDKNGAADVRFQGVDALETHYQPNIGDYRPAGAVAPAGVTKPSPGNHEQPRNLARGAAQAMLGHLGITVTDADWHSWGYVRRAKVGDRVVTDKFQEGVEVVVVACDVDVNGRVLGWIFPGSSALAEGQVLSEAELTAVVKSSVNGLLVAQGLAYAYFYLTMPTSLRGKLAYYSATAQRYRRGLWAADAGTALVPITTLTELHNAVLWPYLFRKALKLWRMQTLNAYWLGGDVSEAAQERLDISQIFATGNPYIYRVPQRDFVRLSQILRVDAGGIQLLMNPRDVVFLD